MYDFVVIGSGISGLSSAIILAKNGYRVAILEKSPSIAPVLRGFSRRGVLFDTGFHYTGGLENGGILDRFFRYLGVADLLVKYPFASDRFDVFRDCGGRGDFHFPIGYDPLQEALCSAFPAEKKAIELYLEAVKEGFNTFPYLNLDASFGDQGALASVSGPSLAEFLDRITNDAALKVLLSLHTLLYGVPPEEVSFAFHAGVVGGYYQSVHGIKGGGLGLLQAFESRLSALGVDIFPSKEVARLRITQDGKMEGIETSEGDVFPCSGCVSTVHPQTFIQLVPVEHLRPVYRRRLVDLDETVSAFILYGVCKNPASMLQGSNLFLGQLEPRETGLFGGEMDERIFYLAGTAPDAHGPGGQGFIAICPAEQAITDRWNNSRRGRRPEDYLQFKEEIIGRMQHRIENCCPELRGHFEVVEGATPLTMRDFAANPRKGLYGAKHKVGQYNPMPVTRVRGLFLAGQSVAAPGILGGVLSAFLTCGHVVGQEQLRKEVKACN